jgi:hypothetical protein
MEALSISATLLCCAVLSSMTLVCSHHCLPARNLAQLSRNPMRENALLWNNNKYDGRVDKGQRLGCQFPGSPKYE